MSKLNLPARLVGMNFEAHNQEVAALWAAYRQGHPFRTPVILGINTRFLMAHPEANPEQVTFEQYCTDPDTMFDCQLRFQHFLRFNMLQDYELGTPESWQVRVDFQNYYDAAWFGCPIYFADNEVPDTRPIFADDPEAVLCATEESLIAADAKRFDDHFRERAGKETFLGSPISVGHPSWIGTDGVMTTACNLFGADFVCLTMASEPDRIGRLFDFITDRTISRMLKWRKYLDAPVRCDFFGSADDSIALISTKMYVKYVLPYHRRLYDAFGLKTHRSMHLCGDSTRHFVTLRDELGIYEFDTGFPVDFGKLRRDLGSSVSILGGPHVEKMLKGTPEEIREESRRILDSGILDGPFVLREGNNLAPGTPFENTESLYRAGRDYGIKPKGGNS